MAVTGAVVSAVATVGSVGMQIYQGQQMEEAQESQEEANEITRAQNQQQQRDNIRRSIAASRVARAQAEAAGGAASGGGTSIATASGVAGAETTGTASNIGFALGQNRQQNQRFDIMLDAGQSQQRAQRAGAIGGFLGQASQFGGGGEGFANMARYGYNRFQRNREEG